MLSESQNARVSVLRGTATNQYGDIIDDNTVIYPHVPATLVETNKLVQDPSTQTPRTIRQCYCLVPAYLDVLMTDRITDEATGNTYMIIGIQVPPTLVGVSVPARLDLRRVTSVTG